ncbi:hypothetical protein SHXM_01233 [Streptomyces hygroscopicus]|nr:hypothetical protein SHXM_01233 [Streptomyces hygroscopicus]
MRGPERNPGRDRRAAVPAVTDALWRPLFPRLTLGQR